MVKIDITSFADSKSNDIVYLPCKSFFLQFSSKCTTPNLTDLLTCSRNNTRLIFPDHAAPTNITLGHSEKVKAFFKNDVVIHNQLIERTGTCDKNNKQTGYESKCNT